MGPVGALLVMCLSQACVPETLIHLHGGNSSQFPDTRPAVTVDLQSAVMVILSCSAEAVVKCSVLFMSHSRPIWEAAMLPRAARPLPAVRGESLCSRSVRVALRIQSVHTGVSLRRWLVTLAPVTLP